MSEPNLSKAVADATNFLSEVHADVRAMLVSLEAAMERAGWLPWDKKITTADFKATLRGEWLLWWCYRFYAPKGAGETFDRLIAVVCHLSPPDGADHDYATLTAAAVRFPRPTTFAETYGSWNGTDVVTRAALGGAVVTLAPADLTEFSPHASAVAALAFPLCELTSEADLEERLVRPLLAAEAALGAQQ